MKVRIWMIHVHLDEHRVKYMSHHFTLKCAGRINPFIYGKAYEGELEARGLEDVFTILNTKPPAGCPIRSLSVSDVVEVVSSKDVASGYYFCDSIGFKKLEDDWREGTEQ